ncbi:hypothetical protein QQP08_008373 [Theobroma cacao]|nr:hypothetical protein QQP08_008373 [Theobroma cacao]
MMKRLLTFFHRQGFVSLTRRKPCFQLRCLSYTTDHPLEYPSMDRTLASMHSISLNPCFALLGLCRNIDSLKKVHALFVINGIKGDLLCDTKLVSLYGLYGHVGYARLMFDQIPDPDFYSWKACSEMRDIDEGRKVHCQIVKGMYKMIVLKTRWFCLIG